MFFGIPSLSLYSAVPGIGLRPSAGGWEQVVNLNVVNAASVTYDDLFDDTNGADYTIMLSGATASGAQGIRLWLRSGGVSVGTGTSFIEDEVFYTGGGNRVDLPVLSMELNPARLVNFWRISRLSTGLFSTGEAFAIGLDLSTPSWSHVAGFAGISEPLSTPVVDGFLLDANGETFSGTLRVWKTIDG